MLKKLTLLAAAAAVSAIFAIPASAQVGKGLSGPHWQMNIIGVPRDKQGDMSTSNGRQIFVPLNQDGTVARTVCIEYIAGDEFRILDHTAFDDVSSLDPDCAVIEVPSDPGGTLSFDVIAVGLGKPNGYAIVEAKCEITDLIGDCEDALLLDTFTVRRTNGGGPNKNKPKQENITNIFRATGCIDLGDGSGGAPDGDCDAGDDIGFKNVWIFNIEQLVEYLWEYDNKQLKLMQVRFYETTSGEFCDGPCP